MHPHKPEVPHVVPRDKSTVEDVVALTLDVAIEKYGEKEYLPEKMEGESQAVISLKRVKRVKGKSPALTGSLKRKEPEPIHEC